jgi:hypothetical protein
MIKNHSNNKPMSKNKKLQKRVKRLEKMVTYLYDKAAPKSPQNKIYRGGD